MQKILGTRTDDLTGMVFGRLTARAVAGKSKHRMTLWLCECECGGELVTLGMSLRNGDTTSCGCRKSELAAVRMRKLGLANTAHGLYAGGDPDHPLYKTWMGMIARCLIPSHHNYANYGGRGIAVYEEWRNFRTWAAWIEENLGPRPTGHSLDRIDNDGHYAPQNLRWSDRKQQRRNQRSRANALAERIRAACVADCTGVVEE